mgnify:CR=1 FL=1
MFQKAYSLNLNIKNLDQIRKVKWFFVESWRFETYSIKNKPQLTIQDKPVKTSDMRRNHRWRNSLEDICQRTAEYLNRGSRHNLWLSVWKKIGLKDRKVKTKIKRRIINRQHGIFRLRWLRTRGLIKAKLSTLEYFRMQWELWVRPM